MSYNEREHKNTSEFFARVWDEISSAATHVAFGTAAVWAFALPKDAEFRWVMLLYVGVGLLAFKHRKEVGEPLAQASGRTVKTKVKPSPAA